MPSPNRITVLLTGYQRYEKVVSTRGRGVGMFIDAPILAYLIETPNGRILYDAGCDYAKVADDAASDRYFAPLRPLFEKPRMTSQQRISAQLDTLGLLPRDIDLVFVSHLHFDHIGGIGELGAVAVDVDHKELEEARRGEDAGVFSDELEPAGGWRVSKGEYEVAQGVHAIATPGHTAGHRSLFVELSDRAVILCGDAADLEENLVDEVAPGYCWNDDVERAVGSIRKLKRLASERSAELWPNHDISFMTHRMEPFFMPALK